jgi:hypothetical protein
VKSTHCSALAISYVYKIHPPHYVQRTGHVLAVLAGKQALRHHDVRMLGGNKEAEETLKKAWAAGLMEPYKGKGLTRGGAQSLRAKLRKKEEEDDKLRQKEEEDIRRKEEEDNRQKEEEQ